MKMLLHLIMFSDMFHSGVLTLPSPVPTQGSLLQATDCRDPMLGAPGGQDHPTQQCISERSHGQIASFIQFH